MKINENFLKIEASYLFSTVAKKQREYQAAHPEADASGMRKAPGLSRRLDGYTRRVRFRQVQGSRQQRGNPLRGIYHARLCHGNGHISKGHASFQPGDASSRFCRG